MTPDTTLVSKATPSPSPSTSPNHNAPAPSVCAMKSGSRAWIISDDTSMRRLTNPSAQTVRGMAEEEDLGMGTEYARKRSYGVECIVALSRESRCSDPEKKMPFLREGKSRHEAVTQTPLRPRRSGFVLSRRERRSFGRSPFLRRARSCRRRCRSPSPGSPNEEVVLPLGVRLSRRLPSACGRR